MKCGNTYEETDEGLKSSNEAGTGKPGPFPRKLCDECEQYLILSFFPYL